MCHFLTPGNGGFVLPMTIRIEFETVRKTNARDLAAFDLIFLSEVHAAGFDGLDLNRWIARHCHSYKETLENIKRMELSGLVTCEPTTLES